MEATMGGWRDQMHDVLEALARNERISVLCYRHGRDSTRSKPRKGERMSKNWLAIILIAGVSAGCATTGTEKLHGGLYAVDLSSSREVVLTVHGLSCPLCSNNLDGQLRRIKGVEAATIDLKTGAVSVRLSASHSVSSEDLAGAVKNAGFTLKKIEPKGAD